MTLGPGSAAHRQERCAASGARAPHPICILRAAALWRRTTNPPGSLGTGLLLDGLEAYLASEVTA